MIQSNIKLRVFKRTPINMAIAKELAEREPSNEYHLLANSKKIALVTHCIWDTCQFCTAKEDDEGVIEME